MSLLVTDSELIEEARRMAAGAPGLRHFSCDILSRVADALERANERIANLEADVRGLEFFS